MLNAMHALDTVSLHWQTTVKPDIAEKFFEQTGETFALSFVKDINRLMPRAAFRTNEPNRLRHEFSIGREFSRVVYVEVVKTYRMDYTESDWESLAGSITFQASCVGADEYDVVENSPTFLKIRVWWD